MSMQDWRDLREIQAQIDLANQIDKANQGRAQESELPFKIKNFYRSKKWYMDIKKKTENVRMQLFVPPYDDDQVRQGYTQMLDFTFGKADIERMRQLTEG